MEFRLIYEGPLHGQGAKSGHKWEIRRALHPQLQRLWRERPLKDAASSLLAHPALPDKPSVIVEKGACCSRRWSRSGWTCTPSCRCCCSASSHAAP